MEKNIELVRIVVDGDTVNYEIHDNTGMSLLQKDKIDAWIKFYNAEAFGFKPHEMPESVLAIPVVLYLLPVTWFYGVNLVLDGIDKILYDDLDTIYETYSRFYGPFRKEWRGKVCAKEIVDNRLPASRYENIVFYSGGIDAIHAGMNHQGKTTVLVSIPDVENKSKSEGPLRDEKFALLKEFAELTGSGWLLIANNFNKGIFNGIRKIAKVNNLPYIRKYAVVGRYLANLCSVAPFAYAMGIKSLVMGSGFEESEDYMGWAKDGTSNFLSSSFKFAGISFAEQDGLYTRRSQKALNIVSAFKGHDKQPRIWGCFEDSGEQCGKCYKCIRTQLNLLCAGENPKDWGFTRFDEKRFSRVVRSYRWFEAVPCWAWDVIDSIDESRTYPYCNGLLHWLKRVGYKRYFNRTRLVRKLTDGRIFNFGKYPHYARAVWRRLAGK